MDQQERAQLFNEFKTQDTNGLNLNVERSIVQAGRTLSQEALDGLQEIFKLFVAARMMERWDRAKEPPTALHITITVDAQ